MGGMPRGGSTTLYHQLQQHPGVALPFRKETFYFSFNHERGVDWFLDLYRQARPGQIGFDVSPDYFYDERAIERILAFDPDPRAVLSVREPVSWVLSLYNQRAGTDSEIAPFGTFVHEYDLEVGDKSLRLQLSDRLVTRMLERCRSAFGDNLLIYDYDFFAREPLRVLQAIERFVGLQPHFDAANFENVRLNASNRRHNSRLYGLLASERLISWLHRLLPDAALRAARSRYYLAAARKQASDPRDRHDPDSVRLAEEIFGEERAEIREFFREQPLQLGSGSPFRPSPR